MTTLRTTTSEFEKRVYFDRSPTNDCNEKCLTPLMKACKYGRPEQVKIILKEKPLSVLERNDVFKTALHFCAENDEPDAHCAKLVLEADPTIVDIPDDDGHTVLHLAIIAGNLPLVRFLLESGKADPNKQDFEGHSTVHWATVCADAEALELVLSYGGTTNSADLHGAFPIHYAAQMCGNSNFTNDVRNGARVLDFLLLYGAKVHVTDKHGRQPILWAASAGSANAIITLVNGGANVESQDEDGLTALHCAASRGHIECVDELISLCGSKVDTVDNNGCSPIFYAVTLGHADVTEILLEHGANPNRQDGKGRTPSHCGAFKGQFETVRLLAKHDANLWMRNSKGGYPLHDAVRSGRKELVLWLISMRPESIDYYDDDGKRPLHIAVLNNNLEMSKIVLDNGASINPVMKIKGEKMTPLDVALRKNNGHLAKFLSLFGGKPASKLNKTLYKQRSTVRVKNKRSEFRRNSYSSDSISRKHRNVRVKPNKSSENRVVQVHIRADVLTKTVGKSRRDDKKPSCCGGGGGTFPKTRKKKTTAATADKAKECFSENDLCNGGDDDFDYEDDDDDDDDDETNSPAADRCSDDVVTRAGNRRGNAGPKTVGREQKKKDGEGAAAVARRVSSRDKTTTVVTKTAATAKSGDSAAATDGRADETFIDPPTDVTAVPPPPSDVVGDDRREDRRPSSPFGEVCHDDRNKSDTRLRAPRTTKGNGDGRGVPSSVRIDGSEQQLDDDDSGGRIVATTVEGNDRSSDRAVETVDNGETGVDRHGRVGDAGFTVGSPPAPSRAIIGKTDDVGRSTASTHEGGGYNRAIVEVFDRVNTPELLSSTAATGGERTTAFSVLPDSEKPCECPDCRTKPATRKSSTKKTKSRIPRLNNYCTLAPTSDLNTMSVTRAIQLSNRKYYLERLIFYQLSELKRLQIRAGKSDERVLVKRLIEEYDRTGFIGISRYNGPFSFKRFEKYLYDQLLILQKHSSANSKIVIPRVKSIDEIEKLTGELRRINPKKTVLENPDDCLSCTCTTNRCFHATHAYTGIPCAAYIPKFRLNHHQMPKPLDDNNRRFLPDIRVRQRDWSSAAGTTKCLRDVDPSKPITLQLGNGPHAQAIDLATDKLDKNKRYFVTLTIKGAKNDPTDRLQPSNRDVREYQPSSMAHHTHAKSF